MLLEAGNERRAVEEGFIGTAALGEESLRSAFPPDAVNKRDGNCAINLTSRLELVISLRFVFLKKMIAYL